MCGGNVMAREKKIDYLTTYQSAIHVEGYLKSHYELTGLDYKLLESGESAYPVKTFERIYAEHSAGRYSSYNPETGYVEAVVGPKALPELYEIMSRIDAYTTNR
jgi:hypothetical protein